MKPEVITLLVHLSYFLTTMVILTALGCGTLAYMTNSRREFREITMTRAAIFTIVLPSMFFLGGMVYQFAIIFFALNF